MFLSARDQVDDIPVKNGPFSTDRAGSPARLFEGCRP